jgi:hypothetical protein
MVVRKHKRARLGDAGKAGIIIGIDCFNGAYCSASRGRATAGQQQHQGQQQRQPARAGQAIDKRMHQYRLSFQ